MKHFLRRERVQRLLGWLIATYIRFVFATSRWTTINGEAPRRFWDRREPFLGCFWHGRIMMMPMSWTAGVPIDVLSSDHPDGRLMARATKHFGIDTVYGSTTTGGTRGLRAVLKSLKSGRCIAFTPDGPRGPRMRAALGLVAAAKLAGVPILPATHASTRRRILNSWDRFAFALPFGRGVFIWGEPIVVPEDADHTALERLRQQVEDELNRITREADRLCGQETIEPAAAATNSPALP